MEVVGEAKNAGECFSLVRKTGCSLIVLDINLPDRSGFEVLIQLKSEKLISQDVASEKPSHESPSNREFQVLCMIARGKSLKSIAGELCVSEKTVSSYRSRVMEKMKMSTNSDLTLYASEHHLV